LSLASESTFECRDEVDERHALAGHDIDDTMRVPAGFEGWFVR
jgi:hypothetical protein